MSFPPPSPFSSHTKCMRNPPKLSYPSLLNPHTCVGREPLLNVMDVVCDCARGDHLLDICSRKKLLVGA